MRSDSPLQIDMKKRQSTILIESDKHNTPSATTLLVHGCCDCVSGMGGRNVPCWAVVVQYLTLGCYQYTPKFISAEDTEAHPGEPGLLDVEYRCSVKSREYRDDDSALQHVFGSSGMRWFIIIFNIFHHTIYYIVFSSIL